MGVDDEGVGEFDPVVDVTNGGGEQPGEPIGAINVEPQVVRCGIRPDAGQVVDNAGIRRAGGCGHTDDPVWVWVIGNRCGECLGRQAMVNSGHVQRFDADDAQRTGNGGVSVAGEGDLERSVAPDAVRPDISSDDEGREIPNGTSTNEGATGTVGEAGQPREEFQNLVLGGDCAGRLEPTRCME